MAIRSIRVKLFLVVEALLAIVTIAYSAAAYREMRASAIHEATGRLDALTTEWSQLLSAGRPRALAPARQAAASSAVRDLVLQPSERTRAAALDALRRSFPPDSQRALVQIVDPGGGELAGLGTKGRWAHPEVMAPTLRDASSTDSGATGRMIADGDGVVYPIASRIVVDGREVGHVVEWRRTRATVAARDQMNRLLGGDSARILIANRNGDVWTDLREEVPSTQVDLSAPRSGFAVEHDSGTSIASAKPIAGTPWAVVIESPQAVVLVETRKFLRRLLFIGGIAIALGALGVLWLSVSLTKPLAQLTAATEAVAAGDYSQHTGLPPRDDELGRLAKSFDSMVSQVQKAFALQRDVRRLDERYRRLVQDSPEGITLTSLEGKFLAVNPAFVEMLGYDSEEEVRALGAAQIFASPAERAPYVERLKKDGQVRRHEVQLRRKDGGVITVLVTTRYVTDSESGEQYLESVSEDVTELRRVERQAQQSQKMEAVGQLAGGVAHDFNNLLTVILSYSDFLLAELPESEKEHRENVKAIRDAGVSASSLTRQLLVFSRQHVIEPKVMRLNDLVQGTGSMLRRLIGENVELVTALDPMAGAVKVDAGLMEQVVVNLAVNARDAMPKGGALTIESKNVDFHEAVSEQQTLLPAGAYVMLSVSDSGMGMDSATQARVFEPFFTTKEAGKGTGLGLATVYGILKQSGGHIVLYSEPGVGTSFKMYFPRFDESSKAPESLPASEAPARGVETVLVVEDQPVVRAIARQVLERHGYRVLEAMDGESALNVASRHPDAIDLLMTDVVMPRMSGRELSDRFARIRPAAKVLFVSGYTDDAIVHHGVLEREMQFLQKPFTSDALLRKVRSMLDMTPA